LETINLIFITYAGKLTKIIAPKLQKNSWLSTDTFLIIVACFRNEEMLGF
jgi:hypothetical protein